MMVKQIVFNGRFLARRPTGVDRFALETLRAMDRALESGDIRFGMPVKVFVPRNVPPDIHFNNIETVPVGNLEGVLWEQVDLAVASRDAFLVNLCNSAPLLKKNQLCVIHDIAPRRVSRSYGRLFRLWYGFLIPSIFKLSRSVCTVSNFSRSELKSVYGFRDDISVLPEGVDHMYRVSADFGIIDKFGLNKRPYVLAVSSLSPHKNFEIVIRMMESLNTVEFDLVVAGGSNPKVFSSSELALPTNVKYVGYVSDEELKALYTSAYCFVFPSVYEGYGLPPTEAMACGCPVLASDAASIPEVCKSAALYFNPSDESELSKKLLALVSNSSLRQEMKVRGNQRADELKWVSTAHALSEQIKQAIK